MPLKVLSKLNILHKNSWLYWNIRPTKTKTKKKKTSVKEKAR